MPFCSLLISPLSHSPHGVHGAADHRRRLGIRKPLNFTFALFASSRPAGLPPPFC